MDHVMVKLTGSLREHAPEGTEELFTLSWREAQPVEDLLATLGIGLEKVQMVMVSHRAVVPDTLVFPGDRICVFPVEYAVFADWFHCRFAHL